MQSRETDRTTKTKSSSNPIAPSEPQQWGSFRFRNTAFSTNRNARACRESRSHRCHKQPSDSACAHGNSPRPLNATDSRRAAPARKAPSLALRIVSKPPRRHRSKFRPVLQLFCFYEAILRDKTNFQRLDRRNGAPSKGTDRYNLKRASFVSTMCIRAVVRLALFHGPRTDARCSHR